MIGYLFILLSVFFNAAKGYSSKKVSTSLSTTRKILAFNTARLFISFLFALLIIAISGIHSAFKVSTEELLICMVAGISMTLFACAWQATIRSSAYMLASACSSASFILPVLAGIIFWNERLTVAGAISILLIVLALFFLLKYDSKLNGKIDLKGITCLALLLVSQGMLQCMQKMYVLYSVGKNSSVYNLYMFLFATVASAVFLPFTKRETDEENQESPDKKTKYKNAIYMVIMSGSLFAVSLFQSLAAKTVDAVILYPLVSGLSLAGGSMMSAIVFREKPDKNSIIGVILVLFAVILSKF